MRLLAALLIVLLCACASERNPSASRPVPEEEVAQGPTFWSDLGAVAAYTGTGALAGLVVGLAATSGNSCSDADCLTLLAFGVAMAPVGAVIGAGVGIVEVVREHRRANQAAAAARAPEPCPDSRAQGWLSRCEAEQGPISSAADAAQLEGWFASCETMVAREFEAVRISELPAECRSNPVPQWMELDCKRKASLIEQRRAEAVRFLQSERRKRQGSPEFAHCPA
jgi:hypothetical protein